MHPREFEAFDRICRERGAGGDVLEIGATPDDSTLLCLPALSRARSRTGVDLAGDAEHAGFRIVGANANDLRDCCGDRTFDTVLSSSVLEHDPRFWLTLAEIRRVARPGALIVLGVPGYLSTAADRRWTRAARLPLAGALVRRWAGTRLATTGTLVVHNYPGDYYRFSVQAMREVLLDGLLAREVVTHLMPPRIIGSAIMPS